MKNLSTDQRLSRPHLRHALRPLALALLGVGMVGPASALTYNWLGGQGNWSDASKWSLLSGVPGAADTVIINGGSHAVIVNDVRSVGTLQLSSGSLGGSGVLSAGSASFAGVSTVFLGRDDSTQNTLNVSGATSFGGATVTSLRYGQVLNLNGNTTWAAGNGRIEVDGAFPGNSSTNPYRSSAINIGAGTTFTDAGAAAAAGTKEIGFNGGQVNNAGTYVRNGQGTTLASFGFNNTGTVQINAGSFGLTGSSNQRSSSSGVISVASGTSLLLGNANVTAGSISNAGVVQIIQGTRADVGPAASINGAWASGGAAAELLITGNHSVSSLNWASGFLGGTGVLNTGSASFASVGTVFLGRDDSTENTLNVSGATSFGGATVTRLRHGQVLNLGGNATWAAGNGRIEVDGAFPGNSSTDPYRSSAINIGAGTTFTDAGAAAAAGVKQLGFNGGQVNNAGTYLRGGLGATVAQNLNNSGTVQVGSGLLGLHDDFVNTGTLRIDGGAQAYAVDAVLNNGGTLTGTGTLKTLNDTSALRNSGTIDPGSIGAGPVGTLAISGDLTMLSGATLRIDFGSAGAADVLAISDDATWAGTLAVWAPADRAFTLGESFVIATYDQRLGASTFGNFSWLGSGGNPFSVQYNAGDITLSVTAVPEPGTWALWLAGSAFVAGLSRRSCLAARRA